MKMKKNFLISVLCLLMLSCNKEEAQNLDIPLSGHVYDEAGSGVANVLIRIDHGAYPNSSPGTRPDYSVYDSLRTDSSGGYHYLVKYEKYLSYQACCKLPPGFSNVEYSSCKDIKNEISASKVVPVVIDFVLKR